MSNVATDRYWLGFDLGGTKMLSALFDGEMNLIGKRRRKTKGSSNSVSGIERIIETIERNLTDLTLDAKNLAGIGIGCPGPIDVETGEMLSAPNLNWKDLRIGPLLAKHFGCPVQVLNDVDAGVYGEYRFGAGQGARCVVGIFPGTGIGGGCVYKGEIFRGSTITCMEIGQTKVNGDQRLSGTGLVGTVEASASRLAIAAEVSKAVYRNEAPFVAGEAGTDISKIRSGVLAEALEKDPVVKEIIERAAETVGVAAANIVHLLAPDRIILGGGLVEAMPDLFITVVSKVIKKSVLPPFKSRFAVVPAKLGDQAGAIGAAAWVQHHVLENQVAPTPAT